MKDFKEFMKKEFPDLTRSQINELCNTSQATIEGSTKPYKSILVAIAGRYGYEGGAFQEAKEFLGEKMGERLASKNEMLMSKPQLTAEFVKGASLGRAKLLSANEAALFESPEAKRLQAVNATGKQVKELVEYLRGQGYKVSVPPQTIYPALPAMVRDQGTPIYPLEKKDFRHASDVEEGIRNTPLTGTIVQAPSGARFQIMNNSDGQLTLTKLNKDESFRVPTVTAPNPPGSTIYPNPQLLQENIIQLAGVKKREAARI